MANTSTKVYTKDKPLFSRLKAMKKADLLKVPVSTVPFCVRTQNALNRAKIGTLGELVVKRKFDLLKMQNLGRTSVAQLEAYLTELDLSLAYSEEVPTDDVEASEEVAPASAQSVIAEVKSDMVALTELLMEAQRLSAEMLKVNSELAKAVSSMGVRR